MCRVDGIDGITDAGLVPVGELPLQSILVFEPCPSRIAASFLQALSLTEGKHVPHEDLMRLYERTQCVDGVDTADAPRTGPLPLPDLRRSIMELQILCADTSEGDAEEEARNDRRSGRAISADEWVEMKRASEVMSHVDAQVRCVGMVEVSGGHCACACAESAAGSGGRGGGVCGAEGGGGDVTWCARGDGSDGDVDQRRVPSSRGVSDSDGGRVAGHPWARRCDGGADWVVPGLHTVGAVHGRCRGRAAGGLERGTSYAEQYGGAGRPSG